MSRFENPREEDEVREVDTSTGQRAKIIISAFTGPPTPEEDLQLVADTSQEAPIHNAALPSVATLCNSAIGAGVLSLPFAFRKTGR
jgi:hypothetical protein